jgi:2'-5' RNA ligase
LSTGTPDGAPSGSLRLFFALWPTAGEQQAMIASAMSAAAASGGRPIPAGNLHVTLAFLGSVGRARLDSLCAVAREQVRGAPVRLCFQTLQHWARPQILCATADPAAVEASGAAALATRLREATLAAGFSPDLKPFHAHVTVARKVARAPAEQSMTPVSWNCTGFALVMSTTVPGGSVYSALETYPLDGSEKAHK